jgi:hypothetical protein
LDDILLALAIAAAALLYSAVGHGGGSGYLAVMALAGVAPAQMKPAALTLNLLVAGLATWRFARAGAFRWSLLWPFALASAPAAFLGGRLELADARYRPIVGAALILAAWRLFAHSASAAAREGAARPPAPAIALPVGCGLGLLTGLTGVGGGIFLAPLLLLLRWGGAREVAGVSAAFILVNSATGLAGHALRGATLPEGILAWLAAAGIGGAIGSGLGARSLTAPILRKWLAAVLIVAGAKMIAL